MSFGPKKVDRLIPLLLGALTALSGGVAPLRAQMSQGGTGTLVVLNKEAATATLVDLASGEVRATLPTGPNPHELLVSSDGRRSVGSDYGGNTLTVLDVAEARVERTIDLGQYRRPHGLAFLPGDTLLAVTSEANQAVLIVHVGEGRVVSVLPTEAEGSHMVAATGDGGTLVTGNIGSGTVSSLDVASGRLARTWTVPPGPEAITVSRDGAHVWVGSNERGLVSVLDTRTGMLSSPLEGFGWPYRILLVPERNLVVIPDLRRNEVRFVALDSRTEVERLPLADAGPQGVALTPDRATFFLSLSAEGRVAVIDLSTRRVIRTIEVGPTPDGIGFSPLVLGTGEESL